jgi:hypothetical protein
MERRSKKSDTFIIANILGLITCQGFLCLNPQVENELFTIIHVFVLMGANVIAGGVNLTID